MRIKVWGSPECVGELQKKVATHELIAEEVDAGIMQQCDLFIDLDPDNFYSRLDQYEQFYPVPVLVNCVKDTLFHLYLESFGNKNRFALFGYNALPTFIQSPIAETSILHPGFSEQLKNLMQNLNWDYGLVDDGVGMVTPRTVAMMVNEAYYTLQEGTAQKDEIDRAMKLGMGWPYGPFEWCNKIGISHIYDLLHNLYESTHEEVYKISTLLQREYKQEILSLKNRPNWL